MDQSHYCADKAKDRRVGNKWAANKHINQISKKHIKGFEPKGRKSHVGRVYTVTSQ